MEKHLNLSTAEVHTLEQVLKGSMEPPSLKPFLLRLHSLFLDSGEGEVAITEAEAWLVHDVVPFDHRVGSEPTGMSIRRKLAQLLLEFDTEETATPVAGDKDESWEESRKLLEVAHGGDEDPCEDPHED